MRYNEKIAAQVAAYFIHREKGSIKILKLMKLMYLAERESLKRYGEPMMGDALVSMKHGPVMSITLDHINGFIPSIKGGWDEVISDREDHNVTTRNEVNVDKLLELSEADIIVLKVIYEEFGDFDQYKLCDHTHDHCGEWENPKDSSNDIPYERLLKNIGFSSTVASQIDKRINEQKSLDELLSTND